MIDVFDDIMPKSYVKLLNEIVTHTGFEWHYLHDVTFENGTFDPTPGFSHLLYQDGQGGPRIDTFYPPLAEYLDRSNNEIHTLIRVRVGCLLNNTKAVINQKHVDWEYPHMVGLYYLNDTDGPTYIWTPEGLEQIECKAGRMVVFDGSYQHASSCPKNSPSRFVVTYNFTTK